MFSQFSSGSIVYLDFDKKTEVNGLNSVKMMKSYLLKYTSFQYADSKEQADYTIFVYIQTKAMGTRKGRITIVDNKTEKNVWVSKLTKGYNTAFYGYSGSRAAIGKIIKDQLIKKFPEIRKR